MPFPTINEYASAMLLPPGRRPLTSPVLDVVNFGELLRPPPPSRFSHWGSGTFAAVYRYRSAGGKEWALRCIISEPPSDLAIRYQELRKYRSQYSAVKRYYVDAQYVRDGITIQNQPYPVFLMEWVEGRTLGRKVEEFVKSSDRIALKSLASQWYQLVRDTQEVGVAHGDVQHGNIMVTGAGTLKFVDYDTVYVPVLKGRKATAVGTPGYAHPQALAKRVTEFGPLGDTFGALVILVSLLALADDPTCYGRYTEDNLYFSANDLENAKTSAAFHKLLRSRDLHLTRLARQLQNLCSTAPRTDLDFVSLVGLNPAMHSQAATGRTTTASPRPRSQGLNSTAIPRDVSSVPGDSIRSRLPTRVRQSSMHPARVLEIPAPSPKCNNFVVIITFIAAIAGAIGHLPYSSIHPGTEAVLLFMTVGAIYGWASARNALGLATAVGTPFGIPVACGTVGACIGGYVGMLNAILNPESGAATALMVALVYAALGSAAGVMFSPVLGVDLGILQLNSTSHVRATPVSSKVRAGLRAVFLWLTMLGIGILVLRLETPSTVVLSGHQGDVLSVALSKDGKYVASGGRDRTVKFWDSADRRVLNTWVEHRDAVSAVAMTWTQPTPSVLSGSYDGTIRVWRPNSVNSMTRIRLKGGGIQSLVLDSRDTFAAAGCSNGLLTLLDWRSGKINTQVRPSSAPIRNIALSPSGDLLAAAAGFGENGKVFIYLIKPHGVLKRLHRVANVSGPLAFSPDGDLLACGSSELLVTATGKHHWIPIARGTELRGIFFSADRRSVGGIGWSGETIIQDLAGLKNQRQEPEPYWNSSWLPDTVRETHGKMQYAFSCDRSAVATGTLNGNVVVMQRPLLGPWFPK